MAGLITRALCGFGSLGLAKAWNEEDHPRDDKGKFSSTGGGGGDDDEAGEHEPGKGYEPEDQKRHDRAMKSLLNHVGKLEGSLDRAAGVFHDPGATADQIIAAGQDVIKHHGAAGRAYDEVHEVRALYGDREHETPILNNTEDLIGALEEYKEAHAASREALATLREETASRAASAVRAGASRHDDVITQLERDLEAASSSMAARRAALRSKPA
ncbi:hypothetical protein LRS73_17480 [Methylobacterium currus]|uniref:hypothetical protein n=1 Tax=Methylobacterium currus TaxID=2051553 RepID=UPI001E617210|nr:hypothetical protein [Methylobacterium currus]UHC14352.1 hypothetical protein LRS73_17480 [Methylobacterium currus]